MWSRKVNKSLFSVFYWCYKTNMLTYWVKYSKNTENLDSKTSKTKNRRLIMQSKCPLCGIKKSRHIFKSCNVY